MMEAKKSITEIKDKMADSLLLWIDDRIDTLVEANPKLKVASVYLKRGAKNYIAKERDNLNTMIDNASLFLCDENGNIDADMLFNDLIVMFREMDEMPFGKGFIRGTIGKGNIRIALPDNPVSNILFGNTGAIRITDADLIEFKKLMILKAKTNVCCDNLIYQKTSFCLSKRHKCSEKTKQIDNL